MIDLKACALPDRDLAFANIKAAAAYYGVDVRGNSWRDLMR